MPPTQLPKYQALKLKRAELATRSTALQADPNVSAEQLNALADEIKAVDADLEAWGRIHEADRTASAVESTSAVTVHDRSQDDATRGFPNLVSFARAVHAAAGPGGRVDEKLRALYRPPSDPKAAPTNYHQEGHSAEGYMVPPAYAAKIWEIVFDGEDLLGLIGAEPTEKNSVPWLRDETTPWGATGIQARWRAEAAQMTPSKLVTEPASLRLHELYAFATATGELLEDAPLMNSRLTKGAGRAIQWKASESLMRGSGAGQPLGWLHSPCLITQAKESGPQTADTVVGKNLTKMFSRRLAMPGGRWTWLANTDIVPQLIDLKIGNEPSWTAQNQGLAQAPGGLILGIPLRFSEHCATLGDVGDLQLVDLAGYYAAVKNGGIQFASSIHLFFDYNIEAFRWIFRLGGEPFLSAPVSPANGAVTKSSFIALETR